MGISCGSPYGSLLSWGFKNPRNPWVQNPLADRLALSQFIIPVSTSILGYLEQWGCMTGSMTSLLAMTDDILGMHTGSAIPDSPVDFLDHVKSFDS